jgi:oligosaccharide repeat unit polymerase
MFSATSLRIGIATLGAAATISLLVGSQRRLQAGAGLSLLGLIAAIVLIDLAIRRFEIWNIKYFVLVSYAIFLGFGMLLDLGDDKYFFSGNAVALTLGGLACFLVGFYWQHNRGKGRHSKSASFWLTPNQLFATALLLYLIGFGFLCAEWYLYGQLQSYSGRLVSSRGIPVAPMPLVHVFAQLVGPASFVTLVLVRRGTTPVRKGVLVVLFASTLIWYVLWGARESFLALAIAFVIVWAEIPKPQTTKRVGLAPVLAVCLAFGIMLGLSVVRTNWDLSQARSEGLSGVLERVRDSINMFGELRRTVDFFPDRMRFLNGYSFYGVAASVVPRVWWPGKPIGVGKLTSILYDHNPDSSIALSLPGELYANFGMAGSLLGMLAFGALIGCICRWYRWRRGCNAAIIIYANLVAWMFLEVRGDILDSTAPLLYHLVPMILMFSVFTYVNKLIARTS